MLIKGYNLRNPEKVERALRGTPAPNGNIGGVIKEDGTYNRDELLAEYDKLGGLITKNGDKVKMGSFYDFKNKKPRIKPQVIFTYRVNGEFVEVPEDEPTPNIVKAVKILEKSEEEKGKKKENKEEEEDEEEKEETEEEIEENLEEEKPKRGRPKNNG